jgi:hypothetical protein
MGITLTYSRSELLARLSDVREAAVKRDEKELAKHEKAEAAFFKRFQKALKEAQDWDYEAAKANLFEVAVKNDRGWSDHGPTCPRSEASVVDRMVGLISKTSQERFSISPDGKWRDVYNVLTADVPDTDGLC